MAIRWLAAAPLLKPSKRFAVAPFDFDCALKMPDLRRFSSGREYASILRRSDLVFCCNRKSAKSSNEEEPAQIEHVLMSIASHAPCDGACIALPYIWFAYANNFGRE